MKHSFSLNIFLLVKVEKPTFTKHEEQNLLSGMKAQQRLLVFIYGAGARAIDSEPRGSDVKTISVCTSVSYSTRLENVANKSNLCRQNFVTGNRMMRLIHLYLLKIVI